MNTGIDAVRWTWSSCYTRPKIHRVRRPRLSVTVQSVQRLSVIAQSVPRLSVTVQSGSAWCNGNILEQWSVCYRPPVTLIWLYNDQCAKVQTWLRFSDEPAEERYSSPRPPICPLTVFNATSGALQHFLHNIHSMLGRRVSTLYAWAIKYHKNSM